MEAIIFLSIIIALFSIFISYLVIRRVKKQIAEITDALADVKNGNGNRRILSATNELVAPLAYEINEIIVSYEKRLSAIRQTEETNRQLMTSLCSLAVIVVISAVLIICMKETEPKQAKKKAKKVTPKKGW